MRSGLFIRVIFGLAGFRNKGRHLRSWRGLGCQDPPRNSTRWSDRVPVARSAITVADIRGCAYSSFRIRGSTVSTIRPASPS